MPPLGPDLVNAGGWAAFLALTGLVLEALRRGTFVLRVHYDREILRADKLGQQVERMTEAFRELTDEVRRLAYSDRDHRGQSRRDA